MGNSGRIGAVVVAAGASSRLGHPKQLVQVEGKPLLVRVVEAVSNGLSGPLVVVLGANLEAVGEVLEGLNVQSIINPDWESGMGSSIAAGVKNLLEDYDNLSDILVPVCDQPFLSEEIIKGLKGTSEKHPDSIVASGYADTNGPPVIFPKALFEELSKLSGRHGAKHLLISHASEVISYPFPEGEFDIDTAKDYQNLTK